MGSKMTIWVPFPYNDGTTSRDNPLSHENRIHSSYINLPSSQAQASVDIGVLMLFLFGVKPKGKSLKTIVD